MQYREEVLNVELAKILREYGFNAEAEVIEHRKMPDVLIIIGGLKVIIEGRVTKNVAKLNKNTKSRLEEGLADISISVQYPDKINVAQHMDDLIINLRNYLSSISHFIYGRGSDKYSCVFFTQYFYFLFKRVLLSAKSISLNFHIH